jgi:hypothetical protein
VGHTIIENGWQDFEFYTSNIDRLINPDNITNPKLWRDAFEDDEDGEIGGLRRL